MDELTLDQATNSQQRPPIQPDENQLANEATSTDRSSISPSVSPVEPVTMAPEMAVTGPEWSMPSTPEVASALTANQSEQAPESVYPTATIDPMSIIAGETTFMQEDPNLSNNSTNPTPAPQQPAFEPASAMPAEHFVANEATVQQSDAHTLSPQSSTDNFSQAQPKSNKWLWIAGGIVVFIVLAITTMSIFGISVGL